MRRALDLWRGRRRSRGALDRVEFLRDHRVRDVALLKGSKQVDRRRATSLSRRDRLARGESPCVCSCAVIDVTAGTNATCAAAEALGADSGGLFLVDGFKLGHAPRTAQIVERRHQERANRGSVDHRDGGRGIVHAVRPTRSIRYGFRRSRYITPEHNRDRA